MKRHVNPYRINDPHDLFEVSENSSHPELCDAKRIWKFRGRTFRSATEVQKYFDNEGLNPKLFWMMPEWEKENGMKATIVIKIVERVPSDERHLVRELAG